MTSAKLLLNPKEVSAELGIGLAASYNLMHRSDFPSIRIGRRFFVSREGLTRWIGGDSGTGALTSRQS
ncbi:MAG: helix-turn-helix domain-containing protein [Actinomycetota bacterium]|nr:helix-turn-helix domain-containing protein [Actinomycetota bacterium]